MTNKAQTTECPVRHTDLADNVHNNVALICPNAHAPKPCTGNMRTLMFVHMNRWALECAIPDKLFAVAAITHAPDNSGSTESNSNMQ